MGNRQSKQNKATKQSPSKYKPKKEKVKPSEARQRSIGSSSRRRDPQPPTAGASVEQRSLKKGPTVADTTNPHATTTIPASSLSLEPSESTVYVAKNDDKIREETQKDVETEADLEPHPITATQALSLRHGSCTAEKDNKFKDKGTQEGPEPKSVGLENAQFPAQSVHATWQSESPTTSPATSTVLNSHCEEQTIVEVEEKKVLTVSDTSMSHSTVATAPKSSGATAEASREEKRGKRTQDKSKSAQETPLKNGPRAQDGSNHASFKKTVQRKRHKRTGRYALTVDNVLRELKDVSWEKLSKGMSLSVSRYRAPGILFLPGSQRHKIEAEYATEDQWRNAAVQFWLVSDPYASWRRLITELDAYEEHAVAKQIHRYAEKLTDPTLTHANISTVTATVPLEHDELGLTVLGVPERKCKEIYRQSSTAVEERERLIHFYLNISPYASWSHLAGRLYRTQHHDALSAVRRFIKTEPDPTLTLPNLTALLEKVDWDWFGRYHLDIPAATLDMIHSSGGDDSQCRQKCWEVYLNVHPAPSWKQVADGLHGEGYLEELEVAQKKYLKGTAENQRQFEKAMKNGHVKAWLCKLLMYGHAGSGKTTSMERIVGNKPPKHRESTPLATRPTTIYRVNLESKEWAKLTTLNDRKSLLARALIRYAPELVDRLLATRSDGELSTNVNPAPSKAETQVKVKNPASSGSNEPPVQDKPLLVSAEGGALDFFELDSSDEDIEAQADAILESISTDEELVKLMDQLSTSVDPLTTLRILEMIDCGGQPQFHEILPVFLRHLDFYVFVFRLCDQLDSRPLVEFYVDGKSVGAPVKSSQTVEQLLQHCARSMHTYRSTAGSESGCPKIMVLGTHADLELKSEESREQKNEKILKILLPNLKKQIIYHDSNSDQVVFPLKALDLGCEQERNINNIRNILLGSSSVPPVDIPLRWFAFEILLKQMTGALQRGVLSREECFITAMDKLHFEDDVEEFDAAIQYLHNLSVLFYYQDILPGVVFADPQVIYDKVSELVLAHYRLTTNPQSNTSTDDWRNFYKFALVTAEFLSQPEFSKHYVPGLFEREHLIELFKQLLIFASFGESQLFVPALLHELGKKEVDKFRIPSNSRLTVPSLALEFPDGGPRKGLFCSLLSWLVSPDNDCPRPLCISTNSTRAPMCLYRNCIQLDIPKSPATLTLIDAYTHFEVHIQVPEKHAENLCPMLFPSIRKTIFKGLHKAAENLHYSNSTPSAALVCPCGNGDAHIATVNKDIGFWTCSLNKMECDKLSSLQLLWIDTDQSPTANMQCLTEQHLSILVSTLKSHASKWMEIGVHLGFRQGDLERIAADPLLFANAPLNFLQAMLSEWLQRAPGDNRGSPSLNSLKFALNKCDLGATASDLAAQLRD